MLPLLPLNIKETKRKTKRTITFSSPSLLCWDTPRYQTDERHSRRISSPSACISARRRTGDRRHKETPWYKQKPRSARCPEGQVPGPVLIGGWLPWRRIPPGLRSSKPSRRSPSPSSGCWPSTEKAKDTLLSQPETSSSFSRDAINVSLLRFVIFSWEFLSTFLLRDKFRGHLPGELALIKNRMFQRVALRVFCLKLIEFRCRFD